MMHLVLAVLIGVVSSPAGPQAKPDFTGKWSLDAAKSDFGGTPAPASVLHHIEHKEPNVKITTTQKSEAGETTNTRTFSTDGKDSTNKITMMGSEYPVTTSAKWDGQSLAVHASFDAQGTTVRLNDTWTLSADGKVLTIARVTKTPQGDFTTKSVYNKQ
jgi:hypothetical protein